MLKKARFSDVYWNFVEPILTKSVIVKESEELEFTLHCIRWSLVGMAVESATVTREIIALSPVTVLQFPAERHSRIKLF